MKKKSLTFVILAVVLIMILIPVHITFAQNNTQNNNGGSGGGVSLLGTAIEWLINPLLEIISEFLIKISSFVLILSGAIFDWLVNFTIVDLAQNIGSGTPVGTSITDAWATLRDLANMCFIFVLLFAAFKAMFQLNFNNIGTTIRNIIIVALLINFSLFFTKVVIDASNIVAIGFYNSITTNALPLGNASPANSKSIAGAYMQMLGVHTFSSSNILKNVSDSSQILLIGVITSVFMLITAVMLFIVGIMLITRLIILIFIMILSPLALIAYIIPGMKNQFDKWKEALIDQSFFAPLFFALTWVVFRLGNILLGALSHYSGFTTPQVTDFANMYDQPGGTVALLLNYIIIIGFAIAALIIAKQMATRTAGFKMIAGGIGTVAAGGAAWAGRNTLGRASGLISEKKRDEWSKTTMGRAGLWMADKGKKGSFDVRGVANTGVGKAVGAEKVMGIAGKATGKGGFAASVDSKAKAKTTYAKEVYGQTGAEKDLAAKKKGEHEGYIDKNGNLIKGSETLSKEATKRHEEKMQEERNAVERAKKDAEETKKKAQKELEAKKKEMDEAVLPETKDVIKKQIEEAEIKLKTTEKAHDEAIAKRRLVVEEGKYSDAVSILEKEASIAKERADADKKTLDQINNMGKERQTAYAERLDKGLVGTRWLGKFQPKQGYKEAARSVREQAKGKSNKDKAADLLKAMKEEEDKTKGEEGETPTPSPTPTPPTTPPPTPST
jgi:hypothetical protein